jgi:hypothetical protein
VRERPVASTQDRIFPDAQGPPLQKDPFLHIPPRGGAAHAQKARAAAIAVTHGQIDWLLEGCTLRQDVRSWRGELTTRVAPCPACSGRGRRGAGKCGSCDTDGRVKVPEEAAGAILRGLLAAAPAGSRAAQGVVKTGSVGLRVEQGKTAGRFARPADL